MATPALVRAVCGSEQAIPLLGRPPTSWPNAVQSGRARLGAEASAPNFAPPGGGGGGGGAQEREQVSEAQVRGSRAGARVLLCVCQHTAILDPGIVDPGMRPLRSFGGSL